MAAAAWGWAVCCKGWAEGPVKTALVESPWSSSALDKTLTSLEDGKYKVPQKIGPRGEHMISILNVVAQGQGFSAHSNSSWPGQSLHSLCCSWWPQWLSLVPPRAPHPLPAAGQCLPSLDPCHCLLASGGQLRSSLQAVACVLVLQE